MTQALEKRHAAKFPNDQLDLNGGFTFEGILIAAQAWLAAKSTKPGDLMEALRKIKIDQHVMVGGPIQFDSKGQNVNIKATAVENLKRKPTVVLPLESAAAPLVSTRALLPGFARVFESTMKRRRKMMNKHKVKKRKRAQRMKAK